jgi:glucose uptake protein GlcU
LVARFVQLVLGGVLLIIVAGILLALLKANPGNTVVSEVHGWGRWLVGPFNGMFSFHAARATIAVNWGIAAVIYLLAGGLIARLISRSQHSSTSHQEDS